MLDELSDVSAGQGSVIVNRHSHKAVSLADQGPLGGLSLIQSSVAAAVESQNQRHGAAAQISAAIDDAVEGNTIGSGVGQDGLVDTFGSPVDHGQQDAHLTAPCTGQLVVDHIDFLVGDQNLISQRS